eukprot:5866930-Lingulodinium_polyedra.AAC.1
MAFQASGARPARSADSCDAPRSAQGERRSAPAGAARLSWELALSAALSLAGSFARPAARCHCVVPEPR